MAKSINIDNDKSELIKILQKTIQSCNLNFLIGSGCSIPAMEALGPIEQEVEALYKQKKRNRRRKEACWFSKTIYRKYKTANR